MAADELIPLKVISENLFPIVGVGGSAGGLESFKEMVKVIEQKSGMAYIFIQHLSPDYECKLAEILQKASKIPVIEISDNIKIEPDHIYVIPPNKLLIANAGVLNLEPRITGEIYNTIDIFFTSLAEIHQEHAIGVVLSGTGTDGTIGLKTIKDQGGITIAQNKESAVYFGMPQSAIEADVVDFILSPKEIPLHLYELARSSKIIPSNFNISEEIQKDQVFNQIMGLLRTKKGVDFTYYKQTTLRRRILRRKALNRIDDLKDYQHYLLENKPEQDALFNDILIPVTAFFRDTGTFSYICDQVLPELFKNKTKDETIRLWIAGCSTGEEAYSMAICLHEYLGDAIMAHKIQLFATDISESVISKARIGLYQKKDMAGVSETRKKEYFTKIDGGYQVNKTIRQMCVFAHHNFLKDPPFSKMDIISCRNVLIYLEPYLQKKAFSIFHYALNPLGYLVLGKSESAGVASELFHANSQQEKIFARKSVAGKYMYSATEKGEALLKESNAGEYDIRTKKDDFQKAADERLLSKYATVGVIINDQLDIVQFRGATGAYLEAPPGRASHNVLRMAREGLAFELRNAIHKSKSGNQIVRKERIPMDKGKRYVTIEVIPLRNTIESYYLIIFEDTFKPGVSGKSYNYDNPSEGSGRRKLDIERIEALEKELTEVREDTRSITEDQQAVNEELQSANEELLSSSEELQSMNEELETTKEEIQSSNEELITLNQELIERNEQLIYSRKYAEAIVTTIHEPLIVLTKDFYVKSANKAFYVMFENTPQQTVGKLFFELNDNIWDISDLREQMKKILPNHTFFQNFEVTIIIPPQNIRVVIVNACQLINENVNEQLILVAIQDITAQKLFEKELETQVNNRTSELISANLKLVQSNENLKQFASIASHDLQEPLRKIKTFTAIFDKKYVTNIPAEGKELIGKIHTSADRMSLLIKELLRYSKVAQSSEEFVPVDLDVILKNVINDLDLLISETKTSIHYNNALQVIEAIPLQMNQLFYNLLSNAIKFHKEAIPNEIVISSRIVPKEEIGRYDQLKNELTYIEILVADNGIGFEQQFAEQIFKLFERLHSNADIEGTGVGLAICQKIIEIHQGKIFAISEENKGASFHIILPVKQQ